ncbi:Transmembrane 9 superfamily member 3 like [Fagus crenata]
MFCFLKITYNATVALPFCTIVVIVLIWTLVTSPLLVLGGIAGKNSKAEFQAPCHTTKYPREIPPLPWYRGTVPQMTMAGFLPFSAIYIELYYIFASVWGHRIYTIYNILFIVFIILLIVTAFITVALTYFQLAAEDHEWWWRTSHLWNCGQGFAGAASRYLGFRSMMTLLGPMLWGTFLADIVISNAQTDYTRILRAIYGFAQGGQLAAINLESRAALLVTKQQFILVDLLCSQAYHYNLSNIKPEIDLIIIGTWPIRYDIDLAITPCALTWSCVSRSSSHLGHGPEFT